MLICAECLMRRRVASLEATAEPSWDVRPDDGLPPVAQAATVINAVALCVAHFTECVQPQRVSPLVGANGQPIVLSGAAR